MNTATDIEELDPFMPLYVWDKQQNPDERFVLRQFRADYVKFVDHLLIERKKLGCNNNVVADKDWDLVKYAFEKYAQFWPQEYKEFKEQMSLIRHTRTNKAYSESKGVMYVGALPLRFERMLKVLFPELEVNKAFLWKLVRRMRIFKVTGEGN